MNICSSTPIKDDFIKGLRAELNFIRSSICLLQSQGGGGPTIYTGDGAITENRAINVGMWELAIQSNKGGDPTMEVAHSLNEWYASFVNGPNLCTLHVDASGATLDIGAGPHLIATQTTANGTFTTVDAKTVTVVNGIITVITD